MSKSAFIVVLVVAISGFTVAGEIEQAPEKCGRQIKAKVQIIEPVMDEVLTDLQDVPVTALFKMNRKFSAKGPARVEIFWDQGFEEMTVFEEMGSCVVDLKRKRIQTRRGTKLRWRVKTVDCWSVDPSRFEWSVVSPMPGDLLPVTSFTIALAMDFAEGPGAHRVTADLSSPRSGDSWSDSTLFHVIPCDDCTEPCDSACCLPWAPDGECCSDPCWNEVEGHAFCCGFIVEGIPTVCAPGIRCVLGE